MEEETQCAFVDVEDFETIAARVHRRHLEEEETQQQAEAYANAKANVARDIQRRIRHGLPRISYAGLDEPGWYLR